MHPESIMASIRGPTFLDLPQEIYDMIYNYSRRPNFLDLPRELRDMIYDLAVTADMTDYAPRRDELHEVELHRQRHIPGARNFRRRVFLLPPGRTFFGLLHASRQLHAEVMERLRRARDRAGRDVAPPKLQIRARAKRTLAGGKRAADRTARKESEKPPRGDRATPWVLVWTGPAWQRPSADDVIRATLAFDLAPVLERGPPPPPVPTRGHRHRHQHVCHPVLWDVWRVLDTVRRRGPLMGLQRADHREASVAVTFTYALQKETAGQSVVDWLESMARSGRWPSPHWGWEVDAASVLSFIQEEQTYIYKATKNELQIDGKPASFKIG